jgi:molybdopterin/thiamine biosynthesis adenylyltransferase
VQWSYGQAFSRNRGLLTEEEQKKLRGSRVAIAGMGGIGGIDLVTLARLGVGRFSIADPESFELANINRQYGATFSTLNCSKADVMANVARDINPDVDLRVFKQPLATDNIPEFLDGADVFIDAIEVFEMGVRRALFRQAASQGIYGITAGPVGFSAIWIVFDPRGMSFDRYFDMSDSMDLMDTFVAFGTGVAPRATQRSYMDLQNLDVNARIAPSSSLACQLAAGAVGSEVIKILLNKGKVRPAPYYHQFDPFVNRFAHGRLRGGNRNPLQLLKRWLLKRLLRQHIRQTTE